MALKIAEGAGEMTSEYYIVENTQTRSAIYLYISDRSPVGYKELTDLYHGRAVPSDTPILSVGGGSRWCDVIWAGLVPLVSRPVAKALKYSDLTGLAFFDCKIENSQKEYADYVGIQVSGRCLSLNFDDQLSQVITRRLPGGEFFYLKGLVIVWRSDERPDLARSEDETTDFVLASRRFRDVCLGLDCKGIAFRDYRDLVDSNKYFGDRPPSLPINH